MAKMGASGPRSGARRASIGAETFARAGRGSVGRRSASRRASRGSCGPPGGRLGWRRGRGLEAVARAAAVGVSAAGWVTSRARGTVAPGARIPVNLARGASRRARLDVARGWMAAAGRACGVASWRCVRGRAACLLVRMCEGRGVASVGLCGALWMDARYARCARLARGCWRSRGCWLASWSASIGCAWMDVERCAAWCVSCGARCGVVRLVLRMVSRCGWRSGVEAVSCAPWVRMRVEAAAGSCGCVRVRETWLAAWAAVEALGGLDVRRLRHNKAGACISVGPCRWWVWWVLVPKYCFNQED